MSAEIENDIQEEVSSPKKDAVEITCIREDSWREKLANFKLTPEEMEGLSKNQQKKLFKKRRIEETKKERRHKERERKKEKRRALHEAGEPLPRKMRLRDYKDIKYTNHRVVIDLDFFDQMAENDSRMVTKQVNSCYSINRRAKFPLKLCVSSFQGPFKELFQRLQPGSPNWDMAFEENDYVDVFPKEKIVYLSSDSDNVLETIDEDKVYIIGGLVDHNNHKGLCLRRAKAQGISHAQLPISKYVSMTTRKTLTINHVFEIISKYLETNDWKESFYSVLPKRKGLIELEEKTAD